MDDSGFYYRPAVKEDAIDDDLPMGRGRQYFPDTYLDSPILITSRTRWLMALHATEEERSAGKSTPKSRKDQFQRTVSEVLDTGVSWRDYNILDPEEYPRFYHTEWQSTLDSDLTDAHSTALALFSAVRKTIKSHMNTDVTTPGHVIPHRALYWFSRWSYFDSLVETSSKISAESGPNVIRMRLSNHTEVIATKDIWLLSNKLHGKYLLTYDQVLMVKDLFFSRAQVYTAAATLYPGNSELDMAISDVCNWHERCLTRYRNEGFEILKQTEALAKAYLSEMSDDVFVKDGPYPRMLQKVRDKESKLKATTFLADEFDSILRSYKNIQTVVEVFGLLKISGHPLVDPARGGLSAAGEARAPDKSLYSDAVKLDWEFKRTMLLSYIRRHGRWPPLVFSARGAQTKLYKFARRQFRGLNRRSYPLRDWRYCRFRQIVDFDYAPNYLELMDDKAISHYRSNIASVWDNDVKEKSHRRLLMELINRKEFDVKKIVGMIVRREVPLDWFIVALHPKEREFKLDPRMFSMLVLEIRVFFALTEANLADRIFPYLPQQTMTKSRLAISKQFLEMTKPMRDTESLRMFIEIDLSRWNLRWRAMAVNPVAWTLNDMFGVVGIFDFCHEFFAKSMIVVRVNDLRPDGIHLPNPPEGPLLWYNHLGGFEGICQKLWTICTYSMVSLALERLPISYILLGQGDNQILSVITNRDPHRSSTEVLEELRDQITERISKMCESVNQEVKPEECLESTSVITYSKDIYIHGVYRPTALKFHSRLFPHSSQIFPSVRTNIGAIFSTAVAGAEKSETPLLSYFLACLYAGLYLYRCSRGRGPYGLQIANFRKTLKGRFHDFVQFLLSLPSELGGFPVIPFIGFLYKGGSDPLGKSVSAMVGLGYESESRLFNRMLAQLRSDSLYNPKPNISNLFMDPFSAPFMKPATSTDGIARMTIDALSTSQISMPDIKELMGADASRFLDKMVAILKTSRPLNPLIIRDLLDCSIAGVTDTISRMFVATRTLQSVVRELGVPIVGNVLHLESKGLLYMLNRFLELPSNPAPKSTVYNWTRSLRNRWFPGEESPIVGLTTYQPWDFSLKWGTEGINTEGMNAVLVADSDPLNTRGPYDPYVGSKTREKRSEHGYKIVGTDTASKALRKLQLIASQTGSNEDFRLLLDAIGWTRTNTQLSRISDLLPGVSGGTLSHRYAARAGHQDAYNIGSPNFATHCVISSDNTGYLSGGVYDYPLMFQECLLYLLWVLQAEYTVTGNHFLSVTLVTEGTELEPLPSTDVSIDPFCDLEILRFPDNPLAFIPELNLERVAGAVSHPSLDIRETFSPSNQLRRHVLEAFFRHILRKRSLGRQVSDGAVQHFPVETMDIAEVVSNSLYAIAHAIKAVVLDEAIANYMMTSVSGKQRWKVNTYAMKLIPLLVGSVSPSFGHPLIMQDPLVNHLRLYDTPNYAGGFTSPHSRYVGFISRLVMRALRGLDHEYNHRTIGLFTSDNNHIVSETILTAILSDCYIWMNVSGLTISEIQDLLGKRLIPTVREQTEEEDKIDTLIRTTIQIYRSYRMSHPEISRVMRALTSGRIKCYKCTVPDMMKSTRNIDAWGIPITPSGCRSSKTVVHIPDSLPSPLQVNIDPLEVVTGVRELAHTQATDLDILRSTYSRNKGLRLHSSGSALPMWSQFAQLLSKKPVIVVGSGFGAVARVALDNGCPHVFGIDLRSTIPLKAHRFRFYKPPLVRMSQYEEQYTQMSESFTTDGDWLNPRVSNAVMDYDQGNCTLVLDIQSGSTRYGLEVLEPALRRKTAGVILMRLYLTRPELSAICADLKGSKITFKVYSPTEFGEYHQYVILITDWRQDELVLATRYTGEVVGQPFPIRLAGDTPLIRAEIISDAIFNVVYVPANTPLSQVADILDDLIIEMMGDYDSRHSYGQWTRYLRARLVVQWALDQDPLGHLQEWQHLGEATLRVKDKVIPILVDWSFLHHLVTFGARLIGL